MTSAQCIEARRLLGLTQLDLAKASRVMKVAIVEFEAAGRLPCALEGNRMSTLPAFFEVEVEFTNGYAPAVRLRAEP